MGKFGLLYNNVGLGPRQDPGEQPVAQLIGDDTPYKLCFELMLISTKFFNKLMNVPSNKSWIDEWPKSDIRPMLNGGMGILKLLYFSKDTNKIMRLFDNHQEYKKLIFGTDDYDMHVSVKAYTESLKEKIEVEFIELLNLYVEYLNKTFTYTYTLKIDERPLKGTIREMDNKLVHLYRYYSYQFTVKNINTSKIILDIDVSIVSASHVDQYGNSLLDDECSRLSGLPIKTTMGYMLETTSILLREHFGNKSTDDLRNLSAVHLRNPFIGKKPNKGKKTIARAFMLAWIILKLNSVSNRLINENKKITRQPNHISSIIYDIIYEFKINVGQLRKNNSPLSTGNYNRNREMLLRELTRQNNLRHFKNYVEQFKRYQNTHYPHPPEYIL